MNFTRFAALTRLEQTLFGLPFLITGALLPLFKDPSLLSLSLLWIFPAFITARLSGMAFNQLIDRKIDAKNPRTRARMIPSGKISPKEASWVAWATLSAFLLICAQINTFCLICAPFAALLIFLYSYSKRVHSSCHFVLGVIHLFSPVMAAGALTGGFFLPSLLLGCTAALLIAGNDILYAFQDETFDRQERLQSIPARFGKKKARLVAAFTHLFCWFFLLFLGVVAKLGVLYFVAPILVALVFLFSYLRGQNSEKILFSSNTSVALIVMICTIMEGLWRVLS